MKAIISMVILILIFSTISCRDCDSESDRRIEALLEIQRMPPMKLVKSSEEPERIAEFRNGAREKTRKNVTYTSDGYAISGTESMMDNRLFVKRNENGKYDPILFIALTDPNLVCIDADTGDTLAIVKDTR